MLITILNHLSKTPIANARFKQYYAESNWQLVMPLTDFLKSDFRYQMGVFTDYLRKENFEYHAYPDGYMIHILNPTNADKVDLEAEFIFDFIYDRFYVLGNEKVEFDKHVTSDVRLQECTKLAIIDCFKLIHSLKRGFNINFLNPIKTDN